VTITIAVHEARNQH